MTAAADTSRISSFDAARGIAALSVVLFHASDARLAPSAYLAVDLFFGLSGFVLERAYGARLGAGMTPGAFMARRLGRLYPLYALGLVLGGLQIGAAIVTRSSAWALPKLGLALVAGLGLIPLWGDNAFPLDFPAWSLWVELAANLLFAIGYRRLSRRVLTYIVAAAAAALLWADLANGSLNGSAAFGGLGLGCLRCLFAFSLGVILARTPVEIRAPTAPVLCLLGCVFLLPVQISLRPWFDFGFAALLVPGVLMLLATDTRHSAVAWALGAASYPIYILHAPMLRAALGVSKRLFRTDMFDTVGAVAFTAAAASAILLATVIWTRLRRVNVPGRSPHASRPAQAPRAALP